MFNQNTKHVKSENSHISRSQSEAFGLHVTLGLVFLKDTEIVISSLRLTTSVTVIFTVEHSREFPEGSEDGLSNTRNVRLKTLNVIKLKVQRPSNV